MQISEKSNDQQTRRNYEKDNQKTMETKTRSPCLRSNDPISRFISNEAQDHSIGEKGSHHFMYDVHVIYSMIDDSVNNRCNEVETSKPENDKKCKLKSPFKGRYLMKPDCQDKQIKHKNERLEYTPCYSHAHIDMESRHQNTGRH